MGKVIRKILGEPFDQIRQVESLIEEKQRLRIKVTIVVDADFSTHCNSIVARQ